MRPKSLLLLTLALGCGLVASVGITQVLDRSGDSGPAAETVPIYVAKTDINLGDKITEELLNLQDWPKGKVPPGAIGELDKLTDRYPRTKIYQGEPLLDAKLLEADARDNPAQQVPSGFRVVSVQVNAHTGGAGLLRPGDRVDVQLFVKRSSQTGIGATKAKTILREIRVFAVDQAFRRTVSGEDASPARTVSLVVTPEQADKLTLATKLGEINLIIRNPDDETNPESDGASISDLFATSDADRDKERGKKPASPTPSGGGFGSFLKQLGQAAATARKTPTQVAVPPWTVLVIHGENAEEIELKQDDDSKWLVTEDTGTAPGPGSSATSVPAIPTSAPVSAAADATAEPAGQAAAHDAAAAPSSSSEGGESDDADQALQDDIDKLLDGPQVDEMGLPIFEGGETD
jgi:pilus assembly protein CpaB